MIEKNNKKSKRIKTILVILLLIMFIVLVILYTVKTNKNLSTTEKFIRYNGDILAMPYGTSDIDIYADGTIWAKSVEYGKVKNKITEEELEKLKNKLKEIDYMNLENQYNVYCEGNYEEITINMEGNEKKIRLNYIMSRYDSTNVPKSFNEFVRLLKETIYEKTN